MPHSSSHNAPRSPIRSASRISSTHEPLGVRAGRSIRHPLTRTLLVLTFTTGLVDAVSYLGLGHVFAANMTGNVVLLGFGIAGSGGLPVVAPLISLGASLLGAGAGGVLGHRMADRHARHLALALSIELLLLAVVALLAATIDVRAGAFSGDTLIALLALAMGVRNATVRRIAVPDLSTTVLTMTLTGLAADSQLFGGDGRGTTRRTAAILAMLLGAVAGALLLKDALALPLVLAAVLTVVAAVLYLPAARGEAAAHEQGRS
jgi:uncharacterized membrane protein YoaK (UPF0700 family)